MNQAGLFAITLYVPDATAQALREYSGLRGLIVDGVPEMDFITPAWWEGSHTARLGLIQALDAREQESDDNSGEKCSAN